MFEKKTMKMKRLQLVRTRWRTLKIMPTGMSKMKIMASQEFDGNVVEQEIEMQE
jgi:hypothetical protein